MGTLLWLICRAVGMPCTLYLQLWLACYWFNGSAALHSRQSAAAACCRGGRQSCCSALCCRRSTQQVPVTGVLVPSQRYMHKQRLSAAAGKDYQLRLRQQHAKMHPRTSWASLKRSQPSKRKAAGESSDEE